MLLFLFKMILHCTALKGALFFTVMLFQHITFPIISCSSQHTSVLGRLTRTNISVAIQITIHSQFCHIVGIFIGLVPDLL